MYDTLAHILYVTSVINVYNNNNQLMTYNIVYNMHIYIYIYNMDSTTGVCVLYTTFFYDTYYCTYYYIIFIFQQCSTNTKWMICTIILYNAYRDYLQSMYLYKPLFSYYYTTTSCIYETHMDVCLKKISIICATHHLIVIPNANILNPL